MTTNIVDAEIKASKTRIYLREHTLRDIQRDMVRIREEIQRNPVDCDSESSVNQTITRLQELSKLFGEQDAVQIPLDLEQHRLQVLETNREQLIDETMGGTECTYQHADGSYCPNPSTDGALYCAQHGKEWCVKCYYTSAQHATCDYEEPVSHSLLPVCRECLPAVRDEYETMMSY